MYPCQDCPYFVDRVGNAYTLKPPTPTLQHSSSSSSGGAGGDQQEGEAAAAAVQTPLSLRLRRAVFPINLRLLADVRVLAWVLVPLALWWLTRSLGMTFFLLSIAVFTAVTAALLAASEP